MHRLAASAPYFGVVAAHRTLVVKRLLAKNQQYNNTLLGIRYECSRARDGGHPGKLYGGPASSQRVADSL
ncbi:hypothetical protein WJX84_011744 [Apatococcus fuscideae]|uniref:Uncharacterized protein n=1 Tax=Apatococcus fuscideae TaxID=2026836 RepID=A0AAW1T8G2_9CHLO